MLFKSLGRCPFVAPVPENLTLCLGPGTFYRGSQPAGSALPTGPAGRAPALGPTRGHQIFKHPAVAANTSVGPGIYSVKRLRVLVFQRLTGRTSQGDRAKRGEEGRQPPAQASSPSGAFTLRRHHSACARRRLGPITKRAAGRYVASDITVSEWTCCFQPGTPKGGGGTQCPSLARLLPRARPFASSGSAKARRAGVGAKLLPCFMLQRADNGI